MGCKKDEVCFIIKDFSGQEKSIILKNVLFLDGAIQANIRQWRNADEIRKYMYNNHIITAEEHAAFLKNLKNNPKTKIFVLFENNIPSGVIQFNNIDAQNKTCEYGMYAVPDAKLNGAYLEFCALSYVFEKLEIEKLNCTVFATNPHVISLHKKFGLIQEGVLRKNILRDNVRIDIICLGILKSEWNSQREKMAHLLNIRSVL